MFQHLGHMASHMTIGHFVIAINLTDYAHRAAGIFNLTKQDYSVLRRAFLSHYPECVTEGKAICQEPRILRFDMMLERTETLTRNIFQLTSTDHWQPTEEPQLDTSDIVHSVHGVIQRAERAVLLIIAALVALIGTASAIGLGAYATHKVVEHDETLTNLQAQINTLVLKDSKLEDAIVFHNRTLQQHEARFNKTVHIAWQLANETQMLRSEQNLMQRILLNFEEAQNILQDMAVDLQNIKHELERDRCATKLLQDPEVQQAFYKFTNRTAARALTTIIDHPEEMAKLPASFVTADGNIIVALGLPAFDNSSVLDVLRWIPTPLIESNSKIIVPTPDNDILAIQNKTYMHRTINEARLLQCAYFKNTFICPRENMLTNDMTSSCLSALYENDLQTVMGLCPLRTSPLRITTFQLTEEKFIVYTPRHLQTKLNPIECQHGFNLSAHQGGEDLPAFIRTTPGLVKIRIPKGCRARLSHNEGPTQTLVWTNPTIMQRVNVSSPVPEKLLNITLIKPLKRPPPAVWQALHDFLKPTQTNDDIRTFLQVTAMQSDINAKLDHQSWIPHWLKPTTWATVGTGAAVILLTIIGICFVCCKRNGNLETQGRTDSNINITVSNNASTPPPNHRAPTPYAKIPTIETADQIHHAVHGPPPYAQPQHQPRTSFYV